MCEVIVSFSTTLSREHSHYVNRPRGHETILDLSQSFIRLLNSYISIDMVRILLDSVYSR